MLKLKKSQQISAENVDEFVSEQYWKNHIENWEDYPFYNVLPYKHSSPKEKTEGIKEAGLKERRKGSFVGYKRSVGPLWDQIMYLQSVEIGGTNKTG